MPASQASTSDCWAIPTKIGCPDRDVAAMRMVPNSSGIAHANWSRSKWMSRFSAVATAVGVRTAWLPVDTNPDASRWEFSHPAAPPATINPSAGSSATAPMMSATIGAAALGRRVRFGSDASSISTCEMAEALVFGSCPPWSSRKGGYWSVMSVQ